MTGGSPMDRKPPSELICLNIGYPQGRWLMGVCPLQIAIFGDSITPFSNQTHIDVEILLVSCFPVDRWWCMCLRCKFAGWYLSFSHIFAGCLPTGLYGKVCPLGVWTFWFQTCLTFNPRSVMLTFISFRWWWVSESVVSGKHTGNPEKLERMAKLKPWFPDISSIVS